MFPEGKIAIVYKLKDIFLSAWYDHFRTPNSIFYEIFFIADFFSWHFFKYIFE